MKKDPGFNFPYVGRIGLKNVVRSFAVSLVGGILIFVLSRTPVIGGYVQAGIARISGFFMHNQA